MDNIGKYRNYLAEIAQKISHLSVDYLNEKRKFKYTDNFLIVSRHWNSETPIVPRWHGDDSDYMYRLTGYGLGGGYFIVSGGIGIAIDPGYNYLQILYSIYGISINDIDVVFITHDHPDHLADLINIITLKQNRQCSNKSLKLYLSSEVFKAFKAFLKGVDNYFALMPNQTIKLDTKIGSIEVKTLRAYHNERMYPNLSSPTALGFLFKIRNSGSLQTYNIAITGDTQFPSEHKKYKKFKEFDNASKSEFCDQYKETEIDILCLHMGSIEKDFVNTKESGDIDHIRYHGFHLGLNGCKDLLDITKMRNSKIVVLTEFGVELKGYRENLAKILQNLTKDGQIVIPADLELMIDFNKPGKEKFLCCKCRRLLKNSGDKAELFPQSIFHEISELIYHEDLQTEMIKYQGKGISCGLS